MHASLLNIEIDIGSSARQSSLALTLAASWRNRVIDCEVIEINRIESLQARSTALVLPPLWCALHLKERSPASVEVVEWRGVSPGSMLLAGTRKLLLFCTILSLFCEVE